MCETLTASPSRRTQDRPLRVLALLPGITPDAGAERSTALMVPRMAAFGVDVQLGLFTPRQTLLPSLESAGIVVHDLSSAVTLAARVGALRSLLRSVPFDLVHATLFEAAAPAQISAALERRSVLVTWATTSYAAANFAGLDGPTWKLRTAQVGEAALARVAGTRFHAVTAGVAEVNAANLHVSAGRVEIGERGRDLALLRASAAGVEGVRREIGLPDGARVVMSIGRQEPEKGYLMLVDAFESVLSAVSDAYLVIAGREGRDSPRLKERVASSPAASRIRLVGHRDDIGELLGLANVVVCSSLREGAAGALIEAMACGVPIVTVALDGLAGVVQDGVNALVVDRSRLADGIGRVLNDGALAGALARGGRATFDERFTLDTSVARTCAIYRWAASATRRRDSRAR